MHLTILNLLAAASPFILIATLWGIWKEGQTRNVMLRMLPPERRPVSNAPQPSWFARAHATSADGNRHLRPLWTLHECQIELLTEATMHAFEASATAYIPDRIAANFPPGLHRADAAAKYYRKPEIDDSTADTLLSYIDPVQAVRIQKAV